MQAISQPEVSALWCNVGEEPGMPALRRPASRLHHGTEATMRQGSTHGGWLLLGLIVASFAWLGRLAYAIT
jgi:hypothetical protein